MNKLTVRMLGSNKVSPASLYTDASIPNDALSCGEESQQSQASLFGGSDVVSSLELFSQPINSSQSQMAQSQSSEHTQRRVATGTSSTVNHTYPSQNQNQARNGPKYYMRYLSSVSLNKMKAGSTTSVTNETPLCSENRVGSTAFSNASYDAWKSKQKEKFEKQLIVDEVVKATRDIANKLSNEIEGLRKELKAIITEEKTQKSDQESLLTDQQTRDIFAQLLQGQAELKQQLLELHRQLALEKTEKELLSTRLLSLESTLATTVVSTVESQVQDYLTKSLETAVVNGLKKHTCVCNKLPASSNCKPIVHSASPSESFPTSLSHDQAVPNNSLAALTENKNDDLFEDDTTTRNTIPKHTILKTSAVQRTNPQSDPLVANDGKIVTVNSALVADTSQGSVSTPCDIDLTQQSPSVCSQVISQHVGERSTSGGNNKRRLLIKTTQEPQCGTNDLLACGSGAHKKTNDQPTPTCRKVGRKVKSTSAKRGGRTNTKSRGGVSKQRRSQRVRKKQSYTFKQDESSDAESLENVGSYGGSAGEICRRVTRTKVPGRDSIISGTQELPSFMNSPMNALDDMFYSQSVSNTQCSPLVTPTQTKGVMEWPNGMADIESQPTTQHSCNSHLLSSDKFHRSSEAARRRKRIIAELSSLDPVLHEINESIRQQKMLKTEYSTALNREVL